MSDPDDDTLAEAREEIAALEARAADTEAKVRTAVGKLVAEVEDALGGA